MASLAAETQLEKDVASNAGVIPIWPWLDEDGKTKDGLPPNIYANRLLEAKRANGQDGAIIRCHHDGCEQDTKSIYWRSTDTPENIVPKGWIDFGPPHHFTYCPSCRAQDVEDIGRENPQEYGRVDITLKHGSTGTSGTSDKQLRSLRATQPSSRPIIPRWAKYGLSLGKESELKKEARKLFKNHPEHLKAVLQQIDDDERKTRANAAQDRKRKKDDEEYYEKRKRTGGRRKKRRKTRRKKRRKTRRKKKHRKKRTRRRRK